MPAHALSMLLAFSMIHAAKPALEPKQFTLQSDKTSLHSALAELKRQTGISVEKAPGLLDRPIRLHRKDVTFWQALDAIAAAGEARVRIYPASGRIVLDKRGVGYHPPPVAYDGRFRLSVRKITASRDPEIRSDDPSGVVCTLTIEVAWDPLLRPLYLETRPRELQLTDDKGHVRTVADDGSSLAPVDGRIALELDVRVPGLPRSVERIGALKGELSMIGPSKMLAFRFPSLAKLDRAGADDPERKLLLDGIACQVRKVALTDQHWSVQVAIDCPPGADKLDSNQSWVVNNEMILESTDGKKRIFSSGYVLESITRRQAILHYHFQDKDLLRGGKASAKTWRVIYRTPADIVTVPIGFSLQDIPLP